MNTQGGAASVRAWSAASHLIVFASIISVPFLLLLGVLLYRSVALERERLERQIVQVMEGLVADLDRDIDRHLTILRTLATLPAMDTGDWPSLYREAEAGLQTSTYL